MINSNDLYILARVLAFNFKTYNSYNLCMQFYTILKIFYMFLRIVHLYLHHITILVFIFINM